MGPRSGRLLAAIAAGTLLAAAVGCGDDELVGLDRVGRADALWPLWDDENRALHDFVVNSRVVRD